MEKQENIIKKTCKELNLTYKQLGELIGFGGTTLNSLASKNNEELSTQLKKAIELYKETITLKEELIKFEELKNILKDITR